MIRTLFIPDGEGNPSHWQDWWALAEPSSRSVPPPDPTRPQPESWELEIAGAIQFYPGSVIVAHGLGASAAVRVLTRWPQLPVTGALLVAPSDDPSASGAERPLHVPAILAASRNDPRLGFARAIALAQTWGAALVDLGFAGHLDAAGPWPRGMELRNQLLPPDTAPPRSARSPRPVQPWPRTLPNPAAASRLPAPRRTAAAR